MKASDFSKKQSPHARPSALGRKSSQAFFSKKHSPPTPFFQSVNSTVQAKLTVGPSNDRHEQEADTIARSVVEHMHQPSPSPNGSSSSPNSQNSNTIQPTNAAIALQTKTIAAAQAKTGATVSPTTDTAIQNAKGGGQPMAENIRKPMEQAFGQVNFRGVRVHTDHQAHRLSQAIQAKAFTTGQDVFFQQGAYAPNSKSGQQLIAHELTHVIQQRQGQSTTIQRTKQEVIVTGVSHLVEKVHSTIYGGKEREAIYQGQRLVIESNGITRSRRGPNQERFRDMDKQGRHIYKWHQVISIDGVEAPKGLYVRSDVFVPFKQDPESSKIGQGIETTHDVVEAVTDVPAALIGNEGITGVADALNDKTIHTDTGGGSDATESGKMHAANMGITGDSITGLTGLLGLAKGFSDLGDPEKKASELIVIGIEIEQAGMKTGEAVAKLVHTGSKSQTPTDASRFGSTFEGFGAAFAGIKSAFLGMKDVVSLIKNHQDYSTAETTKKAGQVAINALETAKSIVLSVKAFIELVEGAAAGHLLAAVPGLDIAISAAKMIMQGYYLAISNVSRKIMNERRQEIAEEKGTTKGELQTASEFYRGKDAEIANKKAVITADRERLKGKLSADKKTKIKQRILELEQKIRALEQEIRFQKQADGDSPIGEVAEYTMVTELRDANTKRVKRQSIHLATEIANIAGAVVTLSGVGGIAGGVIKGSAAAAELSLPVARMAKQAGRDRAARKMAKGKLDKSKFDPTKSTAAKAAFRLKQVQFLIRAIIKAKYPKYQTEAYVKRVDSYLTASGVNRRKLEAENNDPQKQLQMLVDAIEQREFI